MDLWIYGYTDMWLYGYMDIQICGYIAIGITMMVHGDFFCVSNFPSQILNVSLKKHLDPWNKYHFRARYHTSQCFRCNSTSDRCMYVITDFDSNWGSKTIVFFLVKHFLWRSKRWWWTFEPCPN